MSAAQTWTERDGRFHRRGFRRGRRRHCPRTLAGRQHRARARTGPPLHGGGLRARRTRRTGSTTGSPTARRPIHRHSASRPRRRPQRTAGISGSRLRAPGRRQQRALHGQFLAAPRIRLQGAQPARLDRRHELRRLADRPTPNSSPTTRKVEWEVGVSGLAGASPFDPPRTKPYPMPPLPVKSSGVLLERGARKLGLHPFPAPMAINSSRIAIGRACAHCGFCIGFGCEMRAKSSTLYDDDPRGGSHRPLRGAQRILRVPHRRRRPDRATGVAYFDKDKREQLPEGAGGGGVRERRRNAAPAAQVGQRPLPGRAGQLQRRRRPAPDVQHVLRGERAVRARR